MSASINLAIQKNPEKDNQEKLRKVKGISYSVLLIAALVVIAIFALEYRFSASYVKKQQAELLGQLDQYSDKSAKFYLVNSGLTEAGNLLSQRKNYHNTVKEIFNIKPADVSVTEFKYDETGMTVTISTASLGSLDSFLNALLGLINKKVINSVYLQGLSIENGNYTVDILIS
jgi:hypothetical protein